MSWIDQGRQEHGYFGNGTAPAAMTGLLRAEQTELRSRVLAVAEHGSDSLRGNDAQAAAALRQTLPSLRALMPVWAAGSDLPPNDFRRAFFGQDADPVDAWRLQMAASALRRADDHAGLKHAGEALSEAVRSVGGQAWRDCVASAVRQMPALAEAAATEPRDVIRASMPDLALRSAKPAPTRSYPNWLPNSIFLPFSPENERFAAETERMLRSLGSAMADAASELGATISRTGLQESRPKRTNTIPQKLGR